MTIKTYKPRSDARIEAMLVTLERAISAIHWADGDVKAERTDSVFLRVKTLEGWVDLPYGHYLIKGTNGEFYPCDPDVFEQRWEEM